jgi:F0F1-type ATP synthase alpha subunit
MSSLDSPFHPLTEALAHPPQLTLREMGTVTAIAESVATVAGLPHAQADELVMFPGSVPGIVLNLDRDRLGVILLGKSEHLAVGQRVERTGRVMDVPVGEALLGAGDRCHGQASGWAGGGADPDYAAPLSARPPPSFSGRR